MTRQHNSKPCLSTAYNNAYSIFKRIHINEIMSTNKTEWTGYITKMGLNCRALVQSFFQKSDENAVKAICNGGGHVYTNNLCVSTQQFDVFHVRSGEDQNGNFVVVSVKRLRHVVVVACDTIANECLPVHFEIYKRQEPQEKICNNTDNTGNND